MMLPNLFEETRYGMPSDGQLLNRANGLIYYSYLLRQPRWTKHVIHQESEDIKERFSSYQVDIIAA